MSLTQARFSKQIATQAFDLDDVAWSILVELQHNARISFSELGRRVGMTPPAVAERVRRMEEAGIIGGYRVELNVERLGLPLAALVRLAVRGATPAAEIKRAIADMPEVLECYHVTGEDCYFLKVAVPTVHELEVLLEGLVRFGNTTTSIVVSTPVKHRVISRVESRS
jgi:Lrp/AsnC family leucine-responsive transcriptional regulator